MYYPRTTQDHRFQIPAAASIGRFIVDFCCARPNLVIEVDGDSHASQVEYDDSRTVHLEELGYTVIRFTNGQVHRHLDVVLTEIVQPLDRLRQAAPL